MKEAFEEGNGSQWLKGVIEEFGKLGLILWYTVSRSLVGHVITIYIQSNLKIDQLIIILNDVAYTIVCLS